ncbi:DNA-binding transcriptional regulator, GntR family [Cohaesibacter marisflavi]|uniref:DNA-binding transcriptional regulator, GntR family n=2 Tax=Cohaesibacter marisflavi TaxID=655353 RepID=A0A1I5DIR8_9HYPH|nr:DNA-binding transcriptional regulator, GntR family [Cohaesibacter marisflavi]
MFEKRRYKGAMTKDEIVQPDTTPESAAEAEARPLTAHERIYQALRERLLFGGFLPGKAVTLRGLADNLEVSPMPVRDAVRRLTAEGALESHGNRRVSIPAMTEKKYHEINLTRSLLEPELAEMALPNVTEAEIQRLITIDDAIDACLENGDVEGYMRGNHAFHFALYEMARSDVIIKLVENVWMQFGPFMRLVYGRHGTANLIDQHKQAIDALQQGDSAALRTAISEDVHQGTLLLSDDL